MGKSLLTIFIITIANLALAINQNNIDDENLEQDIIQASIAYIAQSSNALAQLYRKHPNSTVINYWYSSQNINQGNFFPAINFLANQVDSYYTKSIRLQILAEYAHQQDWKNYLTIANNHYNQLSGNDKCSYQLAKFMIQHKVDNDYLLLLLKDINTQSDCLHLIKLASDHKKIEYKLMLATLILDNKLTVVKQIDTNIIVKKIDTQKTLKQAIKKQDIYSISSYFASKLKKEENIETDYKLLPSNLPYNFKMFLQNYLSYYYAKKLNFATALIFTNNNNKAFINNDEYEWKIRTYLFNQDYVKALKAINNLPSQLKHKSAWLFWQSYLLLQLQASSDTKSELTKVKNLLNQIDPADLFYYFHSQILLSSLNHQNFNTLPQANTNKLTNELNYQENHAEITQYLHLYKIAISANDYNLSQLSLNLIQYYATHNFNNSQNFILANQLYDLSIYDLSIIFAVKSGHIFDWRLTFPKPFYQNYQQSALNNHLLTNYIMAISRQESRFNPKVIAFDGGIGLMQIMPATAKEIRQKANYEDCVYQYDCNIKYGAWYLAYIGKSFDNNLIYTSAAYNAGPNRAKKWHKILTQLDNKYPQQVSELLQTELIPFNITRSYVQRVLINKFIYDKIDENNNN